MIKIQAPTVAPTVKLTPLWQYSVHQRLLPMHERRWQYVTKYPSRPGADDEYRLNAFTLSRREVVINPLNGISFHPDRFPFKTAKADDMIAASHWFKCWSFRSVRGHTSASRDYSLAGIQTEVAIHVLHADDDNPDELCDYKDGEEDTVHESGVSEYLRFIAAQSLKASHMVCEKCLLAAGDETILSRGTATTDKHIAHTRVADHCHLAPWSSLGRLAYKRYRKGFGADTTSPCFMPSFGLRNMTGVIDSAFTVQCQDHILPSVRAADGVGCRFSPRERETTPVVMHGICMFCGSDDMRGIKMQHPSVGWLSYASEHPDKPDLGREYKAKVVWATPFMTTRLLNAFRSIEPPKFSHIRPVAGGNTSARELLLLLTEGRDFKEALSAGLTAPRFPTDEEVNPLTVNSPEP
jgi:hypothetical protein